MKLLSLIFAVGFGLYGIYQEYQGVGGGFYLALGAFNYCVYLNDIKQDKKE